MYLFYEHHRSPSGEVVATDMLCSSYLHAAPRIDWRSTVDKALFTFLKEQFFKNIPLQSRAYDPDTHIWSFFGVTGATLLEELEVSPLVAAGIKLIAIEELEAQTKANFIEDPLKSKRVPKAEEFFYNTQPVQQQALSPAQLVQKLSQLLLVDELTLSTGSKDELKKLYRKGALRLHPDRNNGDGTAMSTLNQLWRIFNGN